MAPALRVRSAAKPTQQASRTRNAHKHISYREESSDGHEFEETFSNGERERSLSPIFHHKPRRSTCPRTTKKRQASDSCLRSPVSVKKPKLVQSHEHTEEEEHKGAGVPLGTSLVPWTTLPYQILVAIFDYASRPLISDVTLRSPSIPWLLRAALCCKTFTEPALSALYYSPPLNGPSRAKALLDQLAVQDERSTINYRAKIKYLDVDALSTLLRRYAGQDPMDLGALVSLTPQLRGIRIYHLYDDPKYGKSVARTMAGKPAYQESLFIALQERKILLHTWTWNQFLAKQTSSLANLKNVHALAPYQSIQDLSFVNYDGGPLEKGRRREQVLAEALTMLPNLASLRFKKSSIVNSRLLAMLPEFLQTLELSNCSSVDSSALNSFLTSKGRCLRRLVLDHNNSLGLSFLTKLAPNSPKLELLTMDLRYYSTLLMARDYGYWNDTLFKDGEVPSWPASLRCVELCHLPRWNLATAEAFFASLMEAADSLPDLRQLKIKASLDESGWRDRVAFRDRWTKTLHHVFKRQSAPPNPCLQSILAYEAPKRENINAKRLHSDDGHRNGCKEAKIPTRSTNDVRLTRAGLPRVTKTDESDTDAPLIKARRNTGTNNDGNVAPSEPRRSTRAKPYREDLYREDSPPSRPQAPRRRRQRRNSNESSSEDSAIDDDGVDGSAQRQLPSLESPLHVQGMCDVVDVLIDNLRPTEEQLNEDDFLDTEPSGDEDWNGDDDVVGDGGYAW